MIKHFKTTTKEEKAFLLKEDMKNTRINTLDGKVTLLYLCEEIGVKMRIKYFNMIKEQVKKADRTINNSFEVVKKVHDYGLVFNNGFEIRSVDKRVFCLYPNVETKEIKKRE